MELCALLVLKKFATIIIVLFVLLEFKDISSEQSLLSRAEYSEAKFFINPNTNHCQLNVCEVLKYLLQQVGGVKDSTGDVYEKEFSAESGSFVYNLPHHQSLFKRVRYIENRLRSIEQPVWRLASANSDEWNQCTSGVCRCYPETKTFTCWNTNFSSLPVSQVIPMNMVSIDLSRNFFSTLHKDTFRGLTLLKELDLSNNILNFIPAELFKDLDSLIQLRLQNNQLENLNTVTFWKLRNLNLIDVSKNIISEIPINLFCHAQRLIVINFSDNRIKHFPPGLLREQLVLEDLDMSRNEILELKSGSLRNLKELKIIDFSYNSIYVLIQINYNI
ncbi:leucine-rich repeat-containing G-protein coupled receptor 6-like [Rhagoletis pomonella]|uniref:leucine-rich repeat-containing G-protein coupled receptor 6-like n=1 Tax=Rhagoletis pomonella TaxID=28610 RepID=UPI00177AA419|nr:leucine-rich repeat-containing G-protein coupled receptor 6-like [Rhagoletis pomonella]